MLRVITGKYKNMRLDAPRCDTRPTKDKVKEALFSSLFDISDKDAILDLFGGSGAVAIEAISRGIKRAVINDKNKEAYRVIKKNVLPLKEDIMVYNLDYDILLDAIDDEFDIVYLDPPYAFSDHEKLMRKIQENGLLKKDGVIVFEVDHKTLLADRYLDIELYKKRSYGITDLYYYRRREDK